MNDTPVSRRARPSGVSVVLPALVLLGTGCKEVSPPEPSLKVGEAIVADYFKDTGEVHLSLEIENVGTGDACEVSYVLDLRWGNDTNYLDSPYDTEWLVAMTSIPAGTTQPFDGWYHLTLFPVTFYYLYVYYENKDGEFLPVEFGRGFFNIR